MNQLAHFNAATGQAWKRWWRKVELFVLEHTIVASVWRYVHKLLCVALYWNGNSNWLQLIMLTLITTLHCLANFHSPIMMFAQSALPSHKAFARKVTTKWWKMAILHWIFGCWEGFLQVIDIESGAINPSRLWMITYWHKHLATWCDLCVFDCFVSAFCGI